MKVIRSLIATIMLILLLFVGGITKANAANGASYESNGKVSFYGEWKPDKEKPGGGEKPGAGEKPGGEEKPNIDEGGGENPPKGTGNPGDTTNPPVNVEEGSGFNKIPYTGIGGKETVYADKPANVGANGKLPQTGISPYFTYAGITLLLLSIYLLRRRPEHKKE